MGGDFFRNPPGRYLGYCHVVGRALPDDIVSPTTKRFLRTTTFAYMAFDTVYKTIDNRRFNPILKAADALIWQSLATILIPGFVVELAAKGSGMLVHHLQVSKPMSRYIPLGMVLMAMPIFGDSIDRTVDLVLDNTTRPLILR
ncbi:mitochondrial fission process protein 1-like [Homalodisca vitripennis]|uniref:mitochondrial fission process protein 1-like n=1 Tax=Homalodisca vitripennis TaxID=197043 RepID=UPI001EEA7C09|nr:mitochondrial fission process protein 1-like [Homalodisca vitripennis]KAG8282691.1 Mitochondrial fission process protein 1 [Homalodisca vitripennis]